MNKNKGRGKTPSAKTVRDLYIRAGGRCQKCNCDVMNNDIHCKHINHGNVAHIVASSPGGPRANEKSHELSDKLDNLLLLCPKCHKYIDDHPDYYTVEKLREMKETQERNVSLLLNGLDKSKTEFLIFTSAIKNTYDVLVDKKDVIKAIVENEMIPANEYGFEIKIPLCDSYTSVEYWQNAEKAIVKEVSKVKALLDKEDCVISVFPLAPIPMIIKLGNLLSDKRNICIFQKYREPNSWIWLSKKLTNSFSFEKIEISDGNNVALIVSVTAEINLERVLSCSKFDVIYHIKAEKYGVDAIKNADDLRKFWTKYLEVCDLIKNKECVDEISLFPCVPVSVAFEIGRRYMSNVYPKMRVFDECNGFFETIVIGGNNNE